MTIQGEDFNITCQNGRMHPQPFTISSKEVFIGRGSANLLPSQFLITTWIDEIQNWHKLFKIFFKKEPSQGRTPTLLPVQSVLGSERFRGPPLHNKPLQIKQVNSGTEVSHDQPHISCLYSSASRMDSVNRSEGRLFSYSGKKVPPQISSFHLREKPIFLQSTAFWAQRCPLPLHKSAPFSSRYATQIRHTSRSLHRRLDSVGQVTNRHRKIPQNHPPVSSKTRLHHQHGEISNKPLHGHRVARSSLVDARRALGFTCQQTKSSKIYHHRTSQSYSLLTQGMGKPLRRHQLRSPDPLTHAPPSPTPDETSTTRTNQPQRPASPHSTATQRSLRVQIRGGRVRVS